MCLYCTKLLAFEALAKLGQSKKIFRFDLFRHTSFLINKPNFLLKRTS